MDRSTAKVITWVIVLLMLLLTGIGALIGSKTMGYLVAIIGFILICVIQIPFLTCPHCGSLLGRHHLTFTHCPHCGQPLDD